MRRPPPSPSRAALLPSFPFARPPPRRAPGGILLPPVGIGTWAWGNRFLYGYSEEQVCVCERESGGGKGRGSMTT